MSLLVFSQQHILCLTLTFAYNNPKFQILFFNSLISHGCPRMNFLYVSAINFSQPKSKLNT